MKLQALLLHINSKTIDVQRVKTVIIFGGMVAQYLPDIPNNLPLCGGRGTSTKICASKRVWLAPKRGSGDAKPPPKCHFFGLRFNCWRLTCPSKRLGELQEDCSRENTAHSGFEIITLLMKRRDDKAIALRLCNVIPEFNEAAIIWTSSSVAKRNFLRGVCSTSL